MSAFLFSQNQELESLDNVPNDFRALYEEREGKYVVAETTRSVAAALDGLNTALKKSRGEAKDLKSKAVDLSALSDYGTTVEEIAEGFTTALSEAQKQAAAGSKINLDKIKAEWQQANNKVVQAAETKAKALETQLHEVLVTNAAVAAIAAANGNQKLLMPFVQSQIKLVADEKGRLNARVLDDEGDLRYSASTGNPMTPAELVAEMKGQDEYAPLFQSNAPSGGGSKPGTHRVVPKNDRASMSSKDKIAEGLRSRGHNA